MKRFIFSVCALAAVVVGCTKSEVINRPHAEEPIQFNPYTGRIPVTKGTAAGIDSLGKYGFQVYAFMYPSTQGSQVDYTVTPYMNKVVTNTDGKGWTYSGNAYWPGSNLLNFIAYGLNTGNLVTTTDQEHIIKYTVPVTVADQKDLLVALRKSGEKYTEENNGTVNFTFSHLLSRVGFSLVTKKNNGIKVSIEQVDLVGKFYEEGTVDLSNSKSYTLKLGQKDSTVNRPFISTEGKTLNDITYSLLPVAQGDTASFTSVGAETGAPIYDNSMLWVKDYNNTHTPDDDEYKEYKSATDADKAQAEANEQNRYMMIIPVNGSAHQAKLKVKYFLPNAGTFASADVDLKDVNFEPGKSYDFKLKVSTNGISFDVTVEDWDVTGENREVIELN